MVCSLLLFTQPRKKKGQHWNASGLESKCALERWLVLALLKELRPVTTGVIVLLGPAGTRCSLGKPNPRARCAGRPAKEKTNHHQPRSSGSCGACFSDPSIGQGPVIEDFPTLALAALGGRPRRKSTTTSPAQAARVGHAFRTLQSVRAR